MLQVLTSPESAETLALVATLLCVWICAFAAIRVPRESPRLFLALALFGFNWAILLLYYLPGPPQNEILAAFSGFTLIYVGVLLLHDTRERMEGGAVPRPGWLDRLPVYAFRATVGGFGAYLIVRRLFHVEYGWGTLALAVWGTVLSAAGYLAIWTGISAMYAGVRRGRRVAAWLGVLVAAYTAWEISYCVWYARDYWPVYHRFLAAQSSPGAPDFDKPLPFEARPGWPDAAAWAALRRGAGWPALQGTLSLRVEPRVPDMPVPLKHGFTLLKLLLTGAVVVLVWRRPENLPRESPGLWWLEGDRPRGRLRRPAVRGGTAAAAPAGPSAREG